MLQVTGISKRYGMQTVLRDISFILNSGEKVGLVGPNGSGKSTLLRIIAGEENTDSGQIQWHDSGGEMGYLAQALAHSTAESVQQVLDRLLETHSRARTDMDETAALMATVSGPAELERLTSAYSQAEARFEAAGGYELEARLKAALAVLGVADVPRELPVGCLSGGQQSRLALAALLVRQPRLLLLDEPTNHLDQEGLVWLEEWLATYDGAVLIVSHDRFLLDAVTNRTLAIDPVTHSLQDVTGSYSAFLASHTREIEQQWQAYRDQQQEIAHLRQTAQRLRGLARFRRGGKADTNDKFAKSFFGNRSARTMGRARQIEQRLAYLENEGHLEKPAREWGLRIDFEDGDFGARRVLLLEDASISFGEQWLLRNVNLSVRHGACIALVGPNGAGKTTLLRMVAGEIAPTFGKILLGAGIRPGYMSQEQETLDPTSTPLATIRAVAEMMHEAEIRRFLHHFLFSGDDVFVPIERLSFGERARLILAELVAKGCNLLLLDEPINHMDITSRERFEAALLQFSGTILAAVHDRAFIQQLATATWTVADGGVREELL